MKCCGHETETESNETKEENNKEHGAHSEHSSCCGGNRGGITKWLFIVLLVSFLIFFIKGRV